MHGSTRILLVLASGFALTLGWWLLAMNNPPLTLALYGTIWAAAVLLVAYLVFKFVFGYNRFAAGRRVPAAASNGAGLAELDDLRKRFLISADEYDEKRRKLIDRL